MLVLLSTYESHGDVEPIMGLAVRLRALGAEMPVCAPPDFAELPPRAAELVAAQFDTVAAATEECDAPVATGVGPTGVWR